MLTTQLCVQVSCREPVVRRAVLICSIFQFPWCNYSHPGWFQTMNRTPLAQKLPRLCNNGSAGASFSTPLATASFHGTAHSQCGAGTGRLAPESQAQSEQTTPCPTAPRLNLELPITSFHHLERSPVLSAPNPSSHRCQGGQKSWAGLVSERLWSLTKNSPFYFFTSERPHLPRACFCCLGNVISSNAFIIF